MSESRVVAVVDDDLAILDSLRFLLELEGYSVATYHSAVEFLDDRKADAACLIVDHHMPHMTGLDLVARLRGEGASIPILLITGSMSPAIVTRAAQLRIDVLEKPPEESQILKFLEARL